MSRWLGVACTLALGFGCAPQSAPVAIDVTTGLVPGPEFRFVQIEVFDGEGDDIQAHNRVAVYEANAVYGQNFSRAQGLRVAELELPQGRYRVAVRLLRQDRRLLVARTMLIEVGETPIRERFPLDRDCVGDIVCPSPGGSAALTECLGGRCVDERCDPTDVATRAMYCPGVTFCNTTADCPRPAGCARANCNEGVCIPQALELGMAGACPEGQYCNEVRGCIPVASPVDPRTPDCDEFCETDCAAGIWDCDTAGCSIVTFKDSGVACGVDGMCDGAGRCTES